MIIAEMAPQFKPAAAAATSLVAAACLTTAILVPILTGMYAKYMKKRGGVVETAAADAPEAGDELKVAH